MLFNWSIVLYFIHHVWTLTLLHQFKGCLNSSDSFHAETIVTGYMGRRTLIKHQILQIYCFYEREILWVLGKNFWMITEDLIKGIFCGFHWIKHQITPVLESFYSWRRHCQLMKAVGLNTRPEGIWQFFLTFVLMRFDLEYKLLHILRFFYPLYLISHTHTHTEKETISFTYVYSILFWAVEVSWIS